MRTVPSKRKAIRRLENQSARVRLEILTTLSRVRATLTALINEAEKRHVGDCEDQQKAQDNQD
jgi:hypothetical protein